MLEAQIRSNGQEPVALPRYATEAMFVTPGGSKKVSSPRPPSKASRASRASIGGRSRASTPGSVDKGEASVRRHPRLRGANFRALVGIHDHASVAMNESEFRLERRLRSVIVRAYDAVGLTLHVVSW